MTRNVNISTELNELKSSLPAQVPENPYTVPSGYFETLAEQVMLRIKASEAKTAKEELEIAAPLLSGIAKKSPYTVPAGYFEELEEKLMDGIRNSADYQTRDEELREISPLLSGLKKEVPFSVPQGYFENLSAKPAQKPEAEKPGAKVISITSRKGFRYAVAAVMIGFVAISGIVIVNKNEKNNLQSNPHAWIEKKLKKVSTDEIDNFIELTQELPTIREENAVAGNGVDIKELMKDVPDSEIQEFLNETAVLDEGDELTLFN